MDQVLTRVESLPEEIGQAQASAVISSEQSELPKRPRKETELHDGDGNPIPYAKDIKLPPAPVPEETTLSNIWALREALIHLRAFHSKC